MGLGVSGTTLLPHRLHGSKTVNSRDPQRTAGVLPKGTDGHYQGVGVGGKDWTTLGRRSKVFGEGRAVLILGSQMCFNEHGRLMESRGQGGGRRPGEQHQDPEPGKEAEHCVKGRRSQPRVSVSVTGPTGTRSR